jgi:phosphosulfolactate phosphohydrolase-like enzyme
LTTGGGHNAQTKAHCYYTIVRNFANAVEKVEDKQLQAVLHKLCMLFALYQVQRDLGDFTCSGYLAQYVPHTHDTHDTHTRHTHDTYGTHTTHFALI